MHNISYTSNSTPFPLELFIAAPSGYTGMAVTSYDRTIFIHLKQVEMFSQTKDVTWVYSC